MAGGSEEAAEGEAEGRRSCARRLICWRGRPECYGENVPGRCDRANARDRRRSDETRYQLLGGSAAGDEGSSRGDSNPTRGGNRFRRICQKGARERSTRTG